MLTFPICCCHVIPGDGGRGIPVESELRAARLLISTWRVESFEPAGGAKAQIRRGRAEDGDNRSDAQCRIPGNV